MVIQIQDLEYKINEEKLSEELTKLLHRNLCNTPGISKDRFISWENSKWETYFFNYINYFLEILTVYKETHTDTIINLTGSGVPRILQTYSHECFRFSENFVRMTFPISNKLTSEIEKNSKLVEGLVEGLVERLLEGLVENQKKMVYLIDQNPTITIKELAESIGISTTAIDKNLTKLKDKNIVRRIGGDKKGRWELVKNN